MLKRLFKKILQIVMGYTDREDIGTYATLEELWAAYPEGGHEGDWCMVDGVKYRWNKYTRAWESSDGNVSTNARRNDWFEGDVTINHNLTVGGSLRAKRIKQPYLGLFRSEESLLTRWPEPEVGMWALVGEESPFIIWRCDEDGVWFNTGDDSTGIYIDELDASQIPYTNQDESYEGKSTLKDVLDMMISITPKYQSASWLEDEEGVYSADYPERRKAKRYTSMVNAINENRLIKLHGYTAISTSVETIGTTGEMTLAFVVTDSSGVTKIALYIVHYTAGADYCEVQKVELAMPCYDASWIHGSGAQADFIALCEAVSAGIPIRQGTSRMPGYYTALSAVIDMRGNVGLTFIEAGSLVTYTVSWVTDHTVTEHESHTISLTD